ncbi:MAG TPA: hypothetical protein VFS08_13090 [Gemmatimonadaceae bacterium]|nr:hypothetical protein [Gemmatimonadaceae bacterium]
MATLDVVRRAGEALMQDVSREYYLAYAGLKPGADLAAAYARHPRAWDDDALAAALEAWRGAPASGDEALAARALSEWLVETRAARALAPLEEREIAWEHAAVVRLADGRVVPFHRVALEIANAADRRERLALDAARAELVAGELAALRQERLQREQALVAEVGVADGYAAAFQALTGIDLHALGDECTRFLRDTQAMWEDVGDDALRRRLGVPLGEATRADATALLRAPQFDDAFPAGALEATVRTQVESMGVDPRAGGRVRYDTGEREGKRARAFCAPVRIPDEVYLVQRPHGGQGDWRTFLHELGHALHFAYTSPELRFEFRWLGDHSVTEGYAMLLDHLLHDRLWLRRYTELPAARVPEFLHAAAVEELLFLRRYCGKLLYELQLHGGDLPWRALPDAYVTTMGEATGLRHHAADAFVDVDPRFYVARYLRAWQLQAVLTDALRERFDEDWFRNPAAGPWIVTELFGQGQREPADALAVRVAGQSLGFAPLVRALEAQLS